MAHIAITSDLRGAIFAIDHTGALYRNGHEDAEGRGPLVHGGLGRRVGAGWASVRSLAATRAGETILLAGVDDAGRLLSTETGALGNGEWAEVAAPTHVAGASLPPLRRAIHGADGVLYLVGVDGALWRLRHAAPSSAATRGTATLQPGSPERIDDAGWGDSHACFSNGDGLFFEVTVGGTLRVQRVPEGNTPTRDGWRALAHAWSRYLHVMGAGPGRIYAIGSEGSLEVRHYTHEANGDVHLAPRSVHQVVGSGMYPWGGVASSVEGYCWPLSQLPGGCIDFHVGVRLSRPPDGVAMHVADPVTYTVQFRRLRRMHDGKEGTYDDVMPTALDGDVFTATRYVLADDWLSAGAQWGTSFSLTIPDLPAHDPNHWRSGMYAACLTDSEGRNFYVSFVVRPREARQPFAVLANTNTWNAYNSWGGYGKYTHTYPVPETLPFHRPHPGLTPDVAGTTSGLQSYGPSVLTNSLHLLRAELWVLGWLEDQGTDYGYDLYTDQDMHEGIAGLGHGGARGYKGLILNTHPEYWTRQMYDHAKTYLEQGGSIVYLGGNGVYEEVVLSEDGVHMGIFPGLDRARFVSQTLTNEQLRLYCLMRTPAVGRPEHALLGVGFQNCEQPAVEGQPYVLQQEPGAAGSNPVLEGVTVHKGGKLGSVSIDTDPPSSHGRITTYHVDGWEVDQRGFGTPPQAYDPASLLAIGATQWLSGQMLCYTTDWGGTVLAASSLNFGGAMVVDPNLQRIVRNALDRCLTT
jgi:hypothetical protein